MQQLPRQSFRVSRPLVDGAGRRTDYWREATCEEIDCPHYLKGWQTIVGTDGAQAAYIRNASERHFTERRKDGLSTFVFPPGQECFREHRLPTGRPAVFSHHTQIGRTVHARPEDWRDHFAEEMHKLRRMKEG